MERELAFLKRHAFLLAGVGLPLLLVAAVVVARAVPRFLVDDPRHELVYVVHGNYVDGSDRLVQDLVVADGRLVVRWNLSEEPVYRQRARVFRADVASGETVELTIPEALDLEAVGDRRELELPGLEDVHIDPRVLAPDGYEFSSRYSGGGGLFGEIFGRGSRGMRCRVEKDGRFLDVPQSMIDGYGYGSVRFLGWAVAREGSE